MSWKSRNFISLQKREAIQVWKQLLCQVHSWCLRSIGITLSICASDFTRCLRRLSYFRNCQHLDLWLQLALQLHFEMLTWSTKETQLPFSVIGFSGLPFARGSPAPIQGLTLIPSAELGLLHETRNSDRGNARTGVGCKIALKFGWNDRTTSTLDQLQQGNWSDRCWGFPHPSKQLSMASFWLSLMRFMKWPKCSDPTLLKRLVRVCQGLFLCFWGVGAWNYI